MQTAKIYQFPYALNALPEVLAKKWNDDEFKPYRDAFPEERTGSPEQLQAHVEDLTKRDVKVAYLKNLQGYLWENGYKSGVYSTPLFQDVQTSLEKWHGAGFTLAIYSSGSVFAQKLLFEHVKSTVDSSGLKRKRDSETEIGAEADLDGPPMKKHAPMAGNEEKESFPDGLLNVGEEKAVLDKQSETAHEAALLSDQNHLDHENVSTEDLRPLISDWFDTTNAGLKTEAGSYDKIASILEVSRSYFVISSKARLEHSSRMCDSTRYADLIQAVTCTHPIP